MMSSRLGMPGVGSQDRLSQMQLGCKMGSPPSIDSLPKLSRSHGRDTPQVVSSGHWQAVRKLTAMTVDLLPATTLLARTS